jgi:hypothetical protein
MRGFCCWSESIGAKQNFYVVLALFGRGHTSARLHFWHDVWHMTLQTSEMQIH